MREKPILDKVKHIYSFPSDGKIITGATTILKKIANPNLIPWAANTSVNHILFKAKFDAAKDFYEVPGSVLDEARTAHEVFRDKAGDIGTIAHEAIEYWMITNHLPDQLTKEYQEEQRENHKKYEKLKKEDKMMVDHMVENFINWAKDNKVEFLQSENIVFSEKDWYAGTLDFLCKIDGKTYLGDIKTSSGIYDTMWAQCAAYAYALRECEDIKVDKMVIVNIKKNGSIQVKCSDDFEGFMSMFRGALLIHRQKNKIKRGASSISDFLKNAWVVQKKSK